MSIGDKEKVVVTLYRLTVVCIGQISSLAMVGGSRGVPGHHQDGHHSLRPDLDAGRHREQQMFSVWLEKVFS